MIAITRRRLFQRASIGVAAAGALVAAPRLLQSAARPAEAADATSWRDSVRPAPAAASAGSQPVVAYIRDATRGEIAIFAGSQEIVRHDPELVARLLSVS